MLKKWQTCCCLFSSLDAIPGSLFLPGKKFHTTKNSSSSRSKKAKFILHRDGKQKFCSTVIYYQMWLLLSAAVLKITTTATLLHLGKKNLQNIIISLYKKTETDQIFTKFLFFLVVSFSFSVLNFLFLSPSII